jgi:chromosome segregation ATPase
VDRFLKSAYAKSREDVSPRSFLSGDKRWVKRAEAAEETPSKQQYSYICSEELEALVQEGHPLDVREVLPAKLLENGASHLLPPKEVDTIHRMLDVFLRGFSVLAAELTAISADPPATLAKIWVTFCRSAEVQFTAKYKSEISHFLHRDRINLAQKLVEARELSTKVHKHEQEKAVVSQRLLRVLAEQRQIMDDAAANKLEVETWRLKAEEARRERDGMAPKLGSAQARIDSLEEALQGLSQLVEVAGDKDDVREELEAEYGAELQRLQALISAAHQEATNAMAREREVLAAEELTRREKRRAQADASELRDNLQRLQQDFNKLQVSMVEQRARAEAALSSANRELSVERVARESAQRDAAQAQVEITQERQRTKAALQAEADQVGRTRDAAMKLSERECDLANERARVRLADAGRQAAEEAAHALRRQLEGAHRSLSLYRAATGEKAARGDRASLQLATVQHELSEASALIQVMSAENENSKKEAAEMRHRLATSQEGDVEHARALAVVAAEMDALHGKMREAQRTAAAATAELDSTKKQVTECLVSMQEAKEKVADVEAVLEAETKTRVRLEDELGAANAQLADLMRLVRELKAARKDQGGLSDDLIDARVTLSAAREEVDTLRLRLSGFEQEARASMGGSLKAQKDFKSQLETARNELLSVYKIGRKAADGVEPTEEAPVHDGAAFEAVEDALSDLHSRNSRWRDKVKALEDELGRKDEQARDAVAALTAEKEEADTRANEAELNAIRELDIMHETVDQLEGRINRLRVELVDNMLVIQATLDESGHCESSLSCPDAGTANDQDLFSGAKEHVDALRESMGMVMKDKETYANQCAALSVASAEAKVGVANLEAELRTLGETSQNVHRDREGAVAEMKAAKEALSGMEARLTVAAARAQRSESLVNKASKTLGTQAGPGLLEPKPKPEKIDTPQREAIKSNTMDDGLLPERVDEIIPREPPPPPRVLKPNGWGSTWAKAPRTGPDPPLQSAIIREGAAAASKKTSARRRRDEAFLLPGFETASDRLGLRHYFDLMSSRRGDGRGDDDIFYEVSDMYHNFRLPGNRAAQVVSDTNPQPRTKADSQLIRPNPPTTRPQTSPALGGGSVAGVQEGAPAVRRRGSRTSMHATVQRREMPMGTLQLGGLEVNHQQTKVPARLGALLNNYTRPL